LAELSSLFKKYLANNLKTLLICLFLTASSVALFSQTIYYDFINFDDPTYIINNPHLKNGIILESLAWAFKATHAANWHPLTWISHMLDVHIFGMNPGGHHLTNVVFHILNTLLLFIVFLRMTRMHWHSAFIAILFAIHPLHVESVAWVSERKDVLCAFFWFLTMLSYTWYATQPSVYRYSFVMLCFVLGLMSKPMIVTLPFVLLLIDYWPLNRLKSCHSKALNSVSQKTTPIIYLIWEKSPLFILVALSCMMTYYAQKQVGSVAPLENIPFDARIANIIVSYLSYIVKMIYPFNLAVFYPFPETITWLHFNGAGLMLAAISMIALIKINQWPYVAVGWLWFLGTMVPVIGFVQIGAQSMADRYTYIPIIGLFIIITWWIPALLENFRYKRVFFIASAISIIGILTVLSWKQVGYWKNSITLFEHALRVTSDNYLAHNNLGNALSHQGETHEAIRHYQKALKINPKNEKAHFNLAIIFSRQNRAQDAMLHYRKALDINPDFEKAHFNLGVMLQKMGKNEEAIAHYQRAIQIKPDFREAYINLGVALLQQGNRDGAIDCFQKALEITPDDMKAKNLLKKARMIK
jgi:protein O-mannosyl-transferase